MISDCVSLTLCGMTVVKSAVHLSTSATGNAGVITVNSQ